MNALRTLIIPVALSALLSGCAKAPHSGLQVTNAFSAVDEAGACTLELVEAAGPIYLAFTESERASACESFFRLYSAPFQCQLNVLQEFSSREVRFFCDPSRSKHEILTHSTL